MQDPENIYHILYYNNKAAGYYKIILNSPYENCTIQQISNFERLYLQKEFYNVHLGQQLFDFNANIIKESSRSGIWLFMWKENQRAFNFFNKKSFIIIGSHDFKISENLSNPNHQMQLRFKEF